MGRIWMPGGGGGGADLDIVTAVAGDVLKDKVIVGPDGEPLTGTLQLTGDAADSHVLAGKTYYNTDAKTKRTGTIINQGAKNAALNCGGSYTIPAGFHNGSGKVTANSLASQTDANATAGDIRKSKTAYVKGSKITGTLAEKAATTYTPGTADQTISANQILTGVQTIKGDANLVAGNIISGKSIFGVAGNAKVYKTLSITATSSSSKKTFNSGSYYYIEYGSIGFTPCSLVAYHSDINLGTQVTLLIYSSKSSWFYFDPYSKTCNYVSVSSPSYLGSSGFLIPVYRASKEYVIWLTGY